MKNPWVIIGIITVVLFGGAIWFSSTASENNNEGVEIISHIKGNPEAEVKLVEYSDFQCPACAAFYPVAKQIVEDYPDQISFEYKHFPLSNIHPNAQMAAVAAEAAGQQGKFFEFHDLLFENQSEWSPSLVPNALFLEYAEELELDIEQFSRQMKSSMLLDKVRSEFREGNELSVSGTPTFFLNGERMTFGTYQEFIEQITLAIDPSSASTSETGVTTENNEIKFGL